MFLPAIVGLVVLQFVPTMQQFECGTIQNLLVLKIVNGDETSPGEWPWHVAVFHRTDGTDSYVCGGTLISDFHIVTSAHCLVHPETGRELTTEEISVRMGVYQLDELDTENVQQGVIGRLHRFVGSEEHEELKNDIALVELSEAVRFTEFVLPACINHERSIVGRYGVVVGWGLTEEDRPSSVLKSAQLPVIEDIDCIVRNRAVYGQTLDGGLFCAGYRNGTSVCNGDSGGGLFLEREGAWYLAGIVSYSEARDDFSNLCKIDGYGAFTKISKYLDWIQKVTKLQLLEEKNDIPSCPNTRTARPSSSLLPRNCGPYNINRITQGKAANVFEFPWIAVISKQRGNTSAYCTGSLISKRYVLTSRVCARFRPGTTYKVILGEHTFHQDRDCNVNDPDDCAPAAQEFGIECVTHHPALEESQHNIALVRLNRDVVFEDHIQPVCLPLTPALKQLQPAQYIIAGWGQNGHRQWQNSLRKATVQATDLSTCAQIYAGVNITDGQFCAGGNQSADACLDYGAPLGYSAQYNGVRYVQFGVLDRSPAVTCGKLPSVYTKVAAYMSWILANVKP